MVKKTYVHNHHFLSIIDGFDLDLSHRHCWVVVDVIRQSATLMKVNLEYKKCTFVMYTVCYFPYCA